jgi:aminoglycoside phosphotransferase (APT) family kinase protein
MNEFEPYRVVPVDRTEVVSVNRFHPFQAHFMTAESLAKILAQLHGTDVAEASRNARAFVEREHSWEKAGSGLRDLLFQSYE